MDFATLYGHLQHYSDFSQNSDPADRYNNINLFLDTVDTIVTHADPEAIPVFLAYLDDLHTPPEEVYTGEKKAPRVILGVARSSKEGGIPPSLEEESDRVLQAA